MSKEPEPCPFCGKPAKRENKFLQSGIARCSDYQCIVAFTHLSRSASIEEWNTRPTEDALKKELTEQAANYENTLCEYRNTIKEAVEQNDALKEENERLKNALHKIADLRMLNPNLKESVYPSSCAEDMFVNFYCKMGDIAIKALTNETNSLTKMKENGCKDDKL